LALQDSLTVLKCPYIIYSTVPVLHSNTTFIQGNRGNLTLSVSEPHHNNMMRLGIRPLRLFPLFENMPSSLY
jgi:hypothetical protein